MMIFDRTPNHVGTQGRVILIAGPQGAGKTYLANRLCDFANNFVVAPGLVTRPSRGEQDGNDLQVTPQEFKKRSKDGELCLEAVVAGEHYAYLRVGIQNELKAERLVLVLLLYANDVQQALDLWPDAIRIYLRPCEWELICERLIRGRGYATQKAHLAIENGRDIVTTLDSLVWDLRVDVARDTDQVKATLDFLSRT